MIGAGGWGGGGGGVWPGGGAPAPVVCCETYRRATAEYVQLLGGIGFTWEHPAHLYVRRARADEVLFGTADDHRIRLGALLGLRAESTGDMEHTAGP
jgi:alkylation response protein AidB-like acyl-CoA dehydrogenase